MNYKNFSKSIKHVASNMPNLEEYLTDVLKVVMTYNSEVLEWQDMIDILNRKAKGNKMNKSKNKSNTSNADVVKLLKRQIKDLKEMTENGDMDKELKYFGLKAPSGQSWYNFDTDTYLRCATSGLIQKHYDNKECNWCILEHFLLLGQIYE